MARPVQCSPFLLLCAALLLGTGCARKAGEGGGQAEGERLFDSACARCHGRDGRGGFPSAEGQPAPTNFTDPAFQASRTDAELRRVIREGKGPMPPFARLLDEPQTSLVVSHVRTFAPRR
jgi:mono/diheme cytochrome c family protein